MITLKLQERGGDSYDISDRLKYDSDPVLDVAREIDAFQRAFGDVELTLSNMDGYLSGLFLSKSPSTVWDIFVYDNSRRIFVGKINSPIQFMPVSKWITVQVYSRDKEFWERAATMKARALYRQTSETTVTVPVFFSNLFNLGVSIAGLPNLFNLGAFSDLFSSIDIDSVYQGKVVCITPTYGTHAVGSLGMTIRIPYRSKGKTFADMHYNTTVEDFLLDMCQTFNCEFFINPENMKFTMKLRQTVVNDVLHDLDRLIDNSVEPKYTDTTNQQYDFIKYSISILKPEKPTAAFTIDSSGNGFQSEKLGWVVVNVYNYNGQELDSIYSDMTSKFSPVYDPTKTVQDRYKATLTVPVGGQGVTKRKIFRYYGDNMYGLIGTISDNVTTEFVDNFADDYDTPLYAQESLSGEVFIRYDEEEGKWSTSLGQVEDTGYVQPSGRIFEIRPHVTFNDANYKPSMGTMFDVLELFGSEAVDSNWYQRWQGLFMTRRGVSCRLYGKNYAVGDSGISETGLFPNDFTGDKRLIIRNAKISLTKHYSDTELITI